MNRGRASTYARILPVCIACAHMPWLARRRRKPWPAHAQSRFLDGPGPVSAPARPPPLASLPTRTAARESASQPGTRPSERVKGPLERAPGLFTWRLSQQMGSRHGLGLSSVCMACRARWLRPGIRPCARLPTNAPSRKRPRCAYARVHVRSTKYSEMRRQIGHGEGEGTNTSSPRYAGWLMHGEEMQCT